MPDNDDFKTLEKFAGENLDKDSQSDIIEAVPPIYMRATIYIFGAVVIACLLLAYISKVYVIVQSKGSIIPEGQSVVVEAESPGVITDIRVALGDKVTTDQTILELRQDEAGVGLTTLRDQLDIKEQPSKSSKINRRYQWNIAKPKRLSATIYGGVSRRRPALIFIGAVRNIMQKLEQLRSKKDVDLIEQKKLDDQVELQKRTIRSLKNKEKTNIQTIETSLKTIELKKNELKRTAKLAENRVLTEQVLNTARDALLSAQNNLNQQRQALSDTRIDINRAVIEITNLTNNFNTAKRDLKIRLRNQSLPLKKLFQI